MRNSNLSSISPNAAPGVLHVPPEFRWLRELDNLNYLLAATGLEPATSGVTGHFETQDR
jgi:hypothetical protein